MVHSRCTKRFFLSFRFGSTWLFDLRLFIDTVSDQIKFYLQQNKQVIQLYSSSSNQLSWVWKAWCTSMMFQVICTWLSGGLGKKEPGSTSSIEECLILVPEYRHLHLVHVKLCLFEPETAEMTEKYYAFTGNAHRCLLFDCILLQKTLNSVSRNILWRQSGLCFPKAS